MFYIGLQTKIKTHEKNRFIDDGLLFNSPNANQLWFWR